MISVNDVAIVIISWTGQHQNASGIEKSLLIEFPDVSVLYSDQNDQFEVKDKGTTARWIQVPNTFFFSHKFERIIRNFNRRILLTITADARTADWPMLVRQCLSAFSQTPNLGVWSPSINFSSWIVEEFSLGRVGGTDFHRIYQTDSI